MCDSQVIESSVETGHMAVEGKHTTVPGFEGLKAAVSVRSGSGCGRYHRIGNRKESVV
jgi:hypothetical protein